MPRTGSGTYILPAGNPVVPSTTIQSSWANNTLNDIAAALSQSLSKDGQTTPTANLPMGGLKHTGVGDATAVDQYATAGQAQNQELVRLTTAGTSTGTAYQATLPLATTSADFNNGSVLIFTPSPTNTGAATLSINAEAPPVALLTYEGAALPAGFLVAGQTYYLRRVTTGWQAESINLGGEFVAKAGDTMTGSLAFSGAGLRISGDFSNASYPDRTALQTTTVNAATDVPILPNGSSTTAALSVFNNATPTNAAFGQLAARSTDVRLTSGVIGAGTYVPITFHTSFAERMRVAVDGKVTVVTSAFGVGVEPRNPSGQQVSIDAMSGVAQVHQILQTTIGSYGLQTVIVNDGNAYINLGVLDSAGNMTAGVAPVAFRWNMVRSTGGAVVQAMSLDRDGNWAISGGATVAGAATVGGVTQRPLSNLSVLEGVTVAGTSLPKFQWYNGTAGADLKYWRASVRTDGVWVFDRVNDAYSAATEKFAISDTLAAFQVGVALGPGAPAIKMKMITGNCNIAAGGTTTVAHGLTLANVISHRTIVAAADPAMIPENYYLAAYNFNVYLSATDVTVINGASSSVINGAVFRCLITYT